MDLIVDFENSETANRVKIETPMILGGNAGGRLNKYKSARIDTIGATLSRNTVINALSAHAYITSLSLEPSPFIRTIAVLRDLYSARNA